MIEVDKRKAVHLLHEEGMSIRELGRKLGLSRKSVRRIISEKGTPLKITRTDRSQIAAPLLEKLYTDCRGYIQRMHEKLAEEEGITVGYSTLTRLVREMGLGDAGNKKSDRRDAKVPDVPGAEMQHDTSPYEHELQVGGKHIKVVGSSLYLRYSKMRYVKFYPSFTRFRMKCFFHEALTHFGYAAGTCVIDNTNLAVLRGSGAKAVMVPEMEAFAKNYGGFKWLAHEIMHSDRKGGIESGFWFIETNFFPGREFKSIEDLNAQAMEWATRRIPLKPHAKTKLIPAQLFEFEKSALKKLSPYISPPLLTHERETDQYGYAAFDGNYYWIPGRGRGRVHVLEYSEKIRILRNREQLAEYAIAPVGVKNDRTRPAGVPAVSEVPKKCKQRTETEEKRLEAIDPVVSGYLAFIKKRPESATKRQRLIRELFNLSLKLAPQLFIQAVGRAHRYGIMDMDTIERIAVFLMRENSFQADTHGGFDEDTERDLQNREAYREGQVTDLPDLNKYDHLLSDLAVDPDQDNDPETGGSDGKGN